MIQTGTQTGGAMPPPGVMNQVRRMKCWNCEQHPGDFEVVTPRGQTRHLCLECYEDSVLLDQGEDNLPFAWYTPQPHQRPYHRSDTPNLLALGTRSTGKSTMMRKDAIIRCMKYPGFKCLILRRKMPDLRKSHLRFIGAEMKQLGKDIGYYRESTFDVVFANGSFIQFSHCEQMKDVENYLSSEWDLIIFDEVSTFPLEMFTMISAAARSADDAPYKALVRAGSNPLGIGARWMKAWFIDHDVDLAEYPDYLPDEFEMQFSTLDQNKYTNKADYEKRLRVLPEHIKKAWLRGEFVVEGAYFTKFRQLDDDEKPWHAIDNLPIMRDPGGNWKSILEFSWINIYRAVDWGYKPDPAVCLWIAVLPDGREIVFKEKHWKETVAIDVADDIVKESEGMRIVETFCDPSMFAKDGGDDEGESIAEKFENHGVSCTAMRNDRALFGYNICEHLATIVPDAEGKPLPKLQILFPDEWTGLGCKDLLRTIPIQTIDIKDPKKIAAGEDHWVVALAYFCMGRAVASRDPGQTSKKYWQRLPKKQKRRLRYARV